MGYSSNLIKISDDDTRDALDQKLSDISQHQKEQEKKREAEGLGLDFIQFHGRHIPPEAMALLPKDLAEKNQIIVFHKVANLIRLATPHPQDPEVVQLAQALSQEYNRPVDIVVTSEDSFTSALKEYKNIKTELRLGAIDLDAKAIEDQSDQLADFRELAHKAHQTSLSEFVNLILGAAIKVRASDIHFQPERDAVMVRYRVDGVLHDVFNIEPPIYNQLKKRIKLIARLKINIEDKPQDGSIVLQLSTKNIDLRISTLPSNYGESIVIRLLNPEMVALDFESLGFRRRALRIVLEKCHKTTGMIVACGPTGAGKSTTLYTILKMLNLEGTKIITLENPIEYKLPGVLQTQITDEMRFADGLKTAMRQDPDIIMVGEIRDQETAETAINAALTGHLVISTIHTNDAVGAIPRFLALGARSYLLAPALNMIIGQRLARRLCEDCKEPFTLPDDLQARVLAELAQTPVEERPILDLDHLQFFQAVGCPKCSGIGLRGRIGIFEVLDMNTEIVSLIEKGTLTESEIIVLAKKQLMISMLQDGFIKAAEGITTVDEVLRVAN